MLYSTYTRGQEEKVVVFLHPSEREILSSRDGQLSDGRQVSGWWCGGGLQARPMRATGQARQLWWHLGVVGLGQEKDLHAQLGSPQTCRSVGSPDDSDGRAHRVDQHLHYS
jgi:hypothetical protein